MDDRRLDAIERTLGAIAQKIDAIYRLGVATVTHGKTQSEQAWLLSLAGLQPKEIAELLGTTPNTVRVALFNFRIRRKHRSRFRDP